MAKAAREKRMAVPLESLWATLVDYESYPRFLPEVKKTTRVSGQGGVWIVDFEVEIMRPFRYQLKFEEQKPNRLTWQMTSGELFKKNSGAWILKPSGEGQTEARYELEVELGFFVPKWVAQKVTEVQLPQVLERFEAEAARRRAT